MRRVSSIFLCGKNHVTFCFSVPLGYSKYVVGGSGPFDFVPSKEEI